MIGISLFFWLVNERLGNAESLSSEEQSNRKTPSSRIGSKSIFPEVKSAGTTFPSYSAILITNLSPISLFLTLFLQAKKLVLGIPLQHSASYSAISQNEAKIYILAEISQLILWHLYKWSNNGIWLITYGLKAWENLRRVWT